MKGTYSVIPTPFTRSGDVDHESLERVVELYVAAGVDGVAALGVTSESARLNPVEKREVLDTITSALGGRVPLIVGTTPESTQMCVESTKHAKTLGAAAVMISPPRMMKLDSDAVVQHYRVVANAVDLPIVIQDYPPVSGFFMEPALLVRIAREVPSARAIKMEDPPTPFKTARILALAKEIPIDILGGLGGMYAIEELLAGASGLLTGFAIPELLVKIVKLFHSGKRHEAADLFYRTVAIMRFEFQEGIGMAIRKEILRRRGAFATSYVRQPGVQLDDSTSHALDSLLSYYKGKGDLPWI